MKTKFVSFSLILLLSSMLCISNISAQEVWSLEKCISYAIENSLSVEGGKLSLQNSEIDANLAKHRRYPSLSLNSSVGWNFGRTIDPTKNEFITETFFNNGYGLNSNTTLFNSNKINNTVDRAINDNKATLKDLEQTKRDIALNVATLYLNILFSKENLINAENQLELTLNQLDQIKKQISVGNLPENDVLDLEAQLALDEQNIIEAKNILIINLLNLKQLLRLNPDHEMDVMAPKDLKLDSNPDVLTFDEVYQSAMKIQSNIEAGKLRIRSAELGEQIAKADLYPSLFLNANARSNYSNKGVTVDGFESRTTFQDVVINNQNVSVGFKQQVPNFVETAYLDQVSDNLSYGVAFSLSVPIYNNNFFRSAVQRAKLNTMSANLNYTQLKETLKITIGQALADAKAAKSRYTASGKTLQAQNNLYNNAIKRFEIGNLNGFELTRLKTQMETSRVNELKAKYDYLFRTKILDFYLGKPISF